MAGWKKSNAKQKSFLFGILLLTAVSAAGCARTNAPSDTKGGAQDAAKQEAAVYNPNEGALEYDGFLFQINEKKKTAKLTSHTAVDMVDALIPDSIFYEGQEYPVTVIGKSAFESHQSLVTLTLGANLTEIKGSAFYSCPELKELNMSDSLLTIGAEAFGECSELAAVKWGSSLKTIGNNAFRGCVSLTEIELPGSISDCGVGAFTDCYGLKKCIMQDGITSVGEGMFTNCEVLSEVSLPDSISIIGPEAFWGCYELTALELPGKLANIGDRAFYSSNIVKLRMPDSLTGVKFEMLEGMDSITEIEVPKARKPAYKEAFGSYGIKIKTY